MRKLLFLSTTVLLACMLILSSGAVALADAATTPAGRAVLLASGDLPPVNAKGFIAPISPRDPKATPISTAAQLSDMVTGGNYYLTQDIDLGSYNGGIWQPLMASVTLDGQGHVIRNLRIPASAKKRVAGLFGVVGPHDDLIIKNLGIQLHAEGITGYNALADGVVTEYPIFVGGLIGVADSQGTNNTISISNCYVKGDVTGTASGANQNVLAGGLVGEIVGSAPISIVDCYTTGNVRSNAVKDRSGIGGLVGRLASFPNVNNITVDRNYSSCDVSATNNDDVIYNIDVGGLIGCIEKGMITNSHATGTISASASHVYIGGLVGVCENTIIIDSSASGDVSATNSESIDSDTFYICAGGLIGVNWCTSTAKTIAGCYSTGAVEAIATSKDPTHVSAIAHAGGIAGELQINAISDCYSTGSINAEGTYADAGGVTGITIDNGTIINCYAAGLVTATQTVGGTSASGSTGGIAGETYRSSTAISNCYFDSQATGQTQAVGNDGTAGADAGKTTDQMKDQATYTVWDFASVWSINGERNNGYPHLQWQNAHRIFFDSQGGSAVAWQSVNADTAVIEPAAPSRSGYTFTGWYKEPACTNAWDFQSDRVTADTTIYAKWSSDTPTGVKAASASYSSVAISWTAVSGATGYQVYRATSSAGTYDFAGTVTGTSFTNTGLSTGTTYYYKVRSYKGSVYSAFSSVVSAKPVPAAPASPKATPASYNSIKVTWAAVSGATKYEVYRAASSTGTYTLLTTTSYLYCTNTSVNTGAAYYYKVRAYRLVGSTKVYGPFSAVVSARTALGTPGSVKAAPVTYNSIKVSWGAVTGASGYVVYRATSSTGTYASVGSSTSTSFTNSSTGTGITYYYKVCAYRTVGSAKVYSPYSAATSAKTAIGAPTTIKAARASSTSIKVSWSAVAGATRYEVWRSTSSGGTYTLVAVTASLYYTNSSLITGKIYYYKVRAYHLEGSTKVYGPFSKVIYAKP